MQSSAAGKGAAQSAALAAQSRNDLMPWMDQGGSALTTTGDLSGANGPDAAKAAMGNFFTSPGYEWRLSEGQRAIGAHQTAAGMFSSGATEKAQMKFGQGLASDEFSNYYSRLFDLSNQGLGAAKAEAGVGSDSAKLAQGAGNTQASIYGDAASGLGKGANELLGNKDFQAWGKGLFSSAPATSGGTYAGGNAYSLYG